MIHPSQPARFELPVAVGDVLARLPAWPGSMLFVVALNLTLARQLPADVCRALRDRGLRIHVRDARLSFDFAWTGERFAPRAGGAAPDLTITASAGDFLALARREQDPDTLFFSRRLAMEGDTELGLMVKNAMDAMELPVFDPRQFRPPPVREVLARLRHRLEAR